MSDNKTLLLEIGTEEIPAHVMPKILSQLKDLAVTAFKDSRIEIGEIKTLGTPRRLALLVNNVSERQADISEERKGPSVKIAFDADGKPSKAAIGFARGQKINPEDLITKNNYVYAVIHKAGQPTDEMLKTILPKIICSLNFPNNMRWGSLEFKFIRPIRWIVSLFGDEIIPFEIANVKAGRKSRGHRFLGNGDFEIANAADYISDCEKEFVIVDQEQRRTMITAEIEAVAKEHNGKADITEDLLEEVLYLVEYPTALAGNFDTQYLKLPAEAVITPMRDHQRYFPVYSNDGTLMPLFITVRNGGRDYLDVVQHGNERVLKARLEDAQFFFNEDRKKSLAEHREKLKSVVFQEGLGSIYEKTERLATLVSYISEKLNIDQGYRDKIIRAAELSKADLVTGMVTEFTELQGIMGREYALLDGEDADVAAAIDEHYLPRFAGDSQPKTTAGRILSIADKIDNIVATFSRGLIPTGSQDPFALRRQALGIVNLLIEAKLDLSKFDLSISKIADKAMDLLKITAPDARAKIQSELAKFMLLRLKNVLSDANIRYDVVDAVLAENADIYETRLRAQAVEQFLKSPDSVRVIQSFVRVGNLAKKAQNSKVNSDLLTVEAEQVLYKAFVAVKTAADELIDKADYSGALEALKKLALPIDSFFDAVMVMDEDLNIRANRLGLLCSIDNLIARVADFAKIVL